MNVPVKYTTWERRQPMKPPNARLRDPNALRLLIKASGMSYREVGEAAGCTPQMIGALVKGKTPGCTDALARGIAAALGVTADTLFILFVEAPSSNSGGRAEPYYAARREAEAS